MVVGPLATAKDTLSRMFVIETKLVTWTALLIIAGCFLSMDTLEAAFKNLLFRCILCALTPERSVMSSVAPLGEEPPCGMASVQACFGQRTVSTSIGRYASRVYGA